MDGLQNDQNILIKFSDGNVMATVKKKDEKS